jgi:Co/Zn/Cd efflux system component
MIERKWHPPGLLKLFLRLSPWGFPRQVLMILTAGDKTLTEIGAGFTRFMHHFGYFGQEDHVAGFTEEKFIAAVQQAVDRLEREGAVLRRGEMYSLTPEGHRRARQMQREFQTLGRWIQRFQQPQTVALAGLGVHILLAIIKLAIGAISGSIGLITDGMDTAMDGLSSVLVFIGLRVKKEKLVNVVLVLLMLGVGISAGYEAVQRVFIPAEVEASLPAFAAAIFSGLTCLLLSLYQRFVATQSGQQALVTQAVDSRNHAIVAAGVITGLAATLLRFPFLDTLVGLAVAALILKSGGELALEAVQTLRGEKVDFSRYKLDFIEEYRLFLEQQLADWLMHVLGETGPLTQAALLACCRELLDAQDVPILRELGWGKEADLEKQVYSALGRLSERGLVTLGEVLELSEEGRVELGLSSPLVPISG